MSEDAEFEALLKALELEFSDRLPAILHDIAASLDTLRAAPADAEALETAYRQLHSLAGSAGTFGMPDLGLEAKELERMVTAARAAGRLEAADISHLEQGLTALKRYMA
ncbi:Hpt domain-containing protein [Noviherbaspirillum humi]|uniref:Hpt domain-containing protein n=1 Tax=Noviherbaspirillum humi TaxID=1688639 RepID=A0A239DPD3_9BURK|nr:Hpt domain-containing protein [Noviherbaspirillum humi]SNS33758.1 Hpt domain-containing protein [Noviherbaspirillum humi]